VKPSEHRNPRLSPWNQLRKKIPAFSLRLWLDGSCANWAPEQHDPLPHEGGAEISNTLKILMFIFSLSFVVVPVNPASKPEIRPKPTSQGARQGPGNDWASKSSTSRPPHSGE
jgi:hypothetical protein